MALLSLDDDGGSVEIRVGEELTIRLPENATTGYRWAPDRTDEALLELGPSEPDYPDSAPGRGGEVVFRLRAKRAGATEIALKYWRDWEGDASIERRFRIRIEIRP